MSKAPDVKFGPKLNAELPTAFLGEAWAKQRTKMFGFGKMNVQSQPKQMDPRQKQAAAVKQAAVTSAPTTRRESAHKIALPSKGASASAQGHAYSRNWAGAIVPAVGGRRFTAIVGSWKVPAVEGTNGEWSLVSIWVGLGGSRRSSNSMPQIGSEHGWDGSTLIHRLWCQWWLGDNPEGYLSHVITPESELKPGDEITCSLSVNETGKEVEFFWSCGDKTYGTTGNSERPVMANTANWIVERPTEVWQDTAPTKPLRLEKYYKLPTFTDVATGLPRVEMTGCIAQLGLPLGTGGNVASVIDRRPADGRLVSLRSTVPGAGRSFVELEPAVAIDPRDDKLHIIRHLP